MSQDKSNSATEYGGQSSPGASTRHTGREPPQTDPMTELASVWQQVNMFKQRFRAWADSTSELFALECKTSLAAIRQIVILQLLFICLAVFFALSLCGGAGLVVYYFTHNLLAGYAAFVAALGCALIGLLWQQSRLLGLIGFRHTVEQVKEGWDVVFKQEKSRDTNETQ